MKKIFALLLALALVMSMSTTTFATSGAGSDNYNSDEIDTGERTDIDVTASYVPGTEGGIVYSIDLTWTAMAFTYHAASEPVWNATEHKYEGEDCEAYWESGNAGISVTNHSNAVVVVSPTFTAGTGFETVGMKFRYDESVFYVGSAADTNAAVTVDISVTPTGVLPADTTDRARIGYITVKLEEFKNVTQESFVTICDLLTEVDNIAADTGNSDLSFTASNYAAEAYQISNRYPNDMTQDELNAKYLELWGHYVECLAELNG